jgi:hypothetical protein
MPNTAVWLNNPQHWQACADQARDIAAHMTDHGARLRMLKIARRYEKVAVSVAARMRAQAETVPPMAA